MFSSEPHYKKPLLAWFIFLLFTILASSVGYLLFRHLTDVSKADTYNNLTIIGKLKVGQIKTYLKDRQNDAQTFATLISATTEQAWLHTDGEAIPETLRAALSSMLTKYDYIGVVVTDQHGKIRYSKGSSETLSAAAMSVVRRTLSKGKAQISSIYFGDAQHPQLPVLDFTMPIWNLKTGEISGVLLLRSELTTLNGFLQTWPVVSETAESLLVTQEEGKVLFLSQLRHTFRPTLQLKIPFATDAHHPAWPATLATQGKTMVMEAQDYRSETVFASILPVPHTAWGMVVKVDKREALAPIQSLGKIALLVGVVFIALAAHLVWLWGRKQQADRHLAAMRLRDSRTRIESILDTVLDGILTIDEFGIIETVNPATERMFGYAAAEMIGRNVNMLMPPPYREEHDQYLRNYRSSGVPHIIGNGREVLGRRKDGSVFPIELAVSKMNVGQERRFTGLVRDITRRKKSAELLQQAKEKAEQANRAKDIFLASMSHEIRTPLGGMLGMMELLSLGALSEEQRDTLQTARESGENLLRVLNDILDWSKIEEGKLRISLQAMNLQTLLNQVLNNYKPLAEKKGLRLEQTVSPHDCAEYWADSLRLAQILNNFVSNALKFTHIGTVSLRADVLQRDAISEEVCFVVRDSGVGIAADVQQRLFQNYGQGSDETARLYGGTGLGLAISSRLATLMGGEISMESVLGQGSVFALTLRLPLANAVAIVPSTQRALLHPPEPIPPVNAPTTVLPLLVVDDHPINRKLLSRQLAQLGLEVVVAESGSVALEKWRSTPFAAVITDCHMPEMDGYQLTQHIRAIEQQENRPHTPVIAWTANALPAQRNQCVTSGMDDVLTKPTDLVQLQTVLTPWLAQAASPVDGVDFSVLQNIAPNPADQIELLLEFQTHNRLDVQALLAALQSGVHETIRRAAHRTKGASRMVGAQALEAICADIEHRASQQIPIEAAVLTRLATVSSNLDVAITHYAAKRVETKVA